MSKNFLTIFAMFGCWGKYIPGIAGHIIFDVWLGVILFWILINGCGIVLYVLDRIKMKKTAKAILGQHVFQRWARLNLITTISFVLCAEYVVALAFMLTSCTFMLITVNAITKKKQYSLPGIFLSKSIVLRARHHLTNENKKFNLYRRPKSRTLRRNPKGIL